MKIILIGKIDPLMISDGLWEDLKELKKKGELWKCLDLQEDYYYQQDKQNHAGAVAARNLIKLWPKKV